MTLKPINTLILFLMLGLFSLNVNAQMSPKTCYVDSSNTNGTHDGTSWATAYTEFDDAIYANDLNPGDTILVAKGTYTPTTQGNAFYVNVPLLYIYGGFPSGGGTFAQRNWEIDSTILKGNGNSVLYLNQTYNPKVDGFYITEGSDNQYGAGIINNAFGTVLRNLVVYNNTAELGAGLFNNGDNVTIDHVLFKNDTSFFQNGFGSGGAVYNNGNDLTLTDVIFKHNHSEGTQGSKGGAMVNYGDGMVLEEVQFIENSSYSKDNYTSGGALDNSSDNITLRNVTFTANTNTSENENASGGAFRHQGKGAKLEDVTFTQNKVESMHKGATGGAVDIDGNEGDIIQLKNVTFSKNEAVGGEDANGGGINSNGGDKIILRNVTFSENEATGGIQGKGGGMSNSSDTLKIYGASFVQNKAIGSNNKGKGGGMTYDGNSPDAIFIAENVSFIQNQAGSNQGSGSAGGVSSGGMGNVKLSNCVFKNNIIYGSNGTNGGAGLNSDGGDISIVSSVFYGNQNNGSGNSNSYGGALTSVANTMSLKNSTFVNNSVNSPSGSGMGGVVANAGNLIVSNCLFWNNSASTDGDDITNLGTMTINNSFTQSDFSGQGAGNIQGTIDPFRDYNNPDGADGLLGTADDGLALACQSVPIDAGDNAFLSSFDTTDVSGLTRIKGTVDMGAYEYHGLVDNIEYGDVCEEDPYVWNAAIYMNPGSYTHVKSTDGSGCETIDVLTLRAKPDAVVNFLTRPPKICINIYFSADVYTTQDITGISSFSGLPNGVTATYANNTVTLSGTPTESGVFHYSITPTGCGDTEVENVIMVNPDYTINTPSAEPNVCVYTEMDTIIHETSGVQLLGNINGLPDGVTASYNNDTIRVLGTPTEYGTFNYEIEVYGRCGSEIATGTINVLENTIDNNNQETIACLNQSMTSVEFDAPQIDTIEFTVNLPDGIIAEYINDKITLEGTPTESGEFDYTITGKGGCGVALGKLIVSEDMEVQTASAEPELCINTPMDSILHLTANVSGIGTSSSLPIGTSAEFQNDTLVIIGTPTESGVFNYIIDLQGDCGQATATGTITVLPDPTVNAASLTPELCVNTLMDETTHATTEISGIQSSVDLPDGVLADYQNDILTISGTPTEDGIFNYVITLEGTCGTVDAIGTISVTPDDFVSLPSINPNLCINNPVVQITHSTSGVTGIDNIVGLPNGVTANYNNDVITIDGTATETGTFDYTISPEGYCGNNKATGTINVYELPTVDLGNDLSFCEDVDVDVTLDAENNGAAYQWNTGLTTQTIHVTDFGNYSVSVTDQNGCTNVSGVTISAQPLPVNTFQISNLCINNPEVHIIHVTSGVIGINDIDGLPNGVTANYNNDTLTISGTVTETGTFDYTISTDALCGNNQVAGTINIYELPTVDLGSDQSFCEDEAIDVTLDAENNGGSYQWNTGEASQTIHVTDFGTYSVSVTDQNGCTNIAGVTLLSQPLPVTTVNLSEDNILTAANGNADYQWIDCSGDLIDGATQQFFAPGNNGNYALVLTSPFGCVDTSECLNITTVGLSANAMNSMTIYPNPTDKYITVDFGRLIENAQLEIINVAGETILSQTITEKSKYTFQLDVVKGMYFLHIKSNDGVTKVFKIVKQ